MKRLLFLVLVAAVGWYGWHHYKDIMTKTPRHQAVIKNASGETVIRIRLTVGGQTFVREELANGESATFDFAVNQDSHFKLDWEYAANPNEGHWTGGTVTKGPLVARHLMTIRPDRGIVYETTNL
jgi:hypothetical protein